jgi:chemotaxis signal transduction protein
MRPPPPAPPPPDASSAISGFGFPLDEDALAHLATITRQAQSDAWWPAAETASAPAPNDPTHGATLNGVWSVAFSPDGQEVASASMKGNVNLWSAKDHKRVGLLQGHGHWVAAVAWSPDGKQIASGSYDQTVRLWERATSKEVRKLEGHGNWVTSIAFSPDGRQLASAGGDDAVRLWDVATGNSERVLHGHTGAILGLAFGRDGSCLATAGKDGTARTWSPLTGQETRCLYGHEGMVYGVGFSPDGWRLATAGADRTVRTWDLLTGQQLLCCRGHAGLIFQVAYSPDGKLLATAGADRTVRFWDAHTGVELYAFTRHTDLVFCVAFAPDGRHLASGSRDQSVRIWELPETVTPAGPAAAAFPAVGPLAPPREDGAPASYVCFTLGQGDYAVPLDAVRDITRPENLELLPDQPAWLLGQMTLLGDSFPAIDLAGFLKLTPGGPDRGKHLMVVRHGPDGALRGLVVDRVRSIRPLPAPPGSLPDAPVGGSIGDYLQAVIRTEGRPLAVLDLPRLLDAVEKSMSDAEPASGGSNAPGETPLQQEQSSE